MVTIPVLLNPAPTPATATTRTPLVDGSSGGNVPGSPLAADVVHIPPRRFDTTRQHHDRWTYLLIWQTGPLGAIIRHGNASGEIHPSIGQLVALPPGVAYTVTNPGDEPGHHVVAYEFRATPTTAVPSTATPTLVHTDHHEFGLSQQGQPIATLLDGHPGGNVPGSPVSAGLVRMRPGHVAQPHQHTDTWIYVLLRHAGPLGAITLYGPQLEGHIHQAVGQLVVMPPSEAHAAVNPSDEHDIVAYEFRAAPSIHTDNVVLDVLRTALDRQMPVLFNLPQATRRR